MDQKVRKMNWMVCMVLGICVGIVLLSFVKVGVSKDIAFSGYIGLFKRNKVLYCPHKGDEDSVKLGKELVAKERGIYRWRGVAFLATWTRMGCLDLDDVFKELLNYDWGMGLNMLVVSREWHKNPEKLMHFHALIQFEHRIDKAVSGYGALTTVDGVVRLPNVQVGARRIDVVKMFTYVCKGGNFRTFGTMPTLFERSVVGRNRMLMNQDPFLSVFNEGSASIFSLYALMRNRQLALCHFYINHFKGVMSNRKVIYVQSDVGDKYIAFHQFMKMVGYKNCYVRNRCDIRKPWHNYQFESIIIYEDTPSFLLVNRPDIEVAHQSEELDIVSSPFLRYVNKDTLLVHAYVVVFGHWSEVDIHNMSGRGRDWYFVNFRKAVPDDNSIALSICDLNHLNRSSTRILNSKKVYFPYESDEYFKEFDYREIFKHIEDLNLSLERAFGLANLSEFRRPESK